MKGLTAGALVALAITQVCCACAGTPHQDSPPGTGTVAAVATATTRLLQARAAAVLAPHRVVELAATADPGADATVTGLGARLGDLALSSWSYRVLRATAGPAAGQVTVQALLSYRLAADPPGGPPATAMRVMIASPDRAHPGRLLLASERPLGAWLPWDLGSVTAGAADGAQVLDVGGAAAGQDRAVLDATRLAAAAVSAVWGQRWRRVPVVVVVGATDAIAELTGRAPVQVEGLVAVTTADRVYLMMPSWLALPPSGRQVLLTHEVTHLATGAATDPDVPQWLKEGFADYVGFLGSGIPTGQAAAGLLAQVRTGHVPGTLPADAEFSAAVPTAAAAYAGAWLACRLLAGDRGQTALVAVYRATQAGRGTPQANADAALRQVTGLGTAAWTAQWRTWLSALARASAAPKAATARLAGPAPGRMTGSAPNSGHPLVAAA